MEELESRTHNAESDTEGKGRKREAGYRKRAQVGP